ncbi:IgLON family member 5 [Holothuria leucospilota]|uniref:IgLON family member 5 n=1 Tax=Holothuria leucospilota TaxID=206669 RepID=A0A9Q0Y8C0_HOLLE|nr:IgLON family member 5 [Holothuria leucospilota]
MDALIVIAFLLVLPQAWSTIIQVPESGTYSVGSNILLKCITREENINIIWKDLEKDTIIFIGKGKYTKKEKYRNFEISSSPRNYSLIINDASPTDEGFYSCQDGDIHRNAWLTIEVLPTLTLCVNKSTVNASKPITLTTGNTVVVICKAQNIGPNVFLELKYGSGGWMKPKHSQQDSNDKPTCKVEVIHNQIQCICDANPPVKQYKIFVDGEDKGNSKSVQARHYVPANFSCLAVNDIGVGQSEVRYVSKFQGKEYFKTLCIKT